MKFLAELRNLSRRIIIKVSEADDDSICARVDFLKSKLLILAATDFDDLGKPLPKLSHKGGVVYR